METSASFEARSAPSSYPTANKSLSPTLIRFNTLKQHTCATNALPHRHRIRRLRQLELPVFLPWGEADRVLGRAELELRSIFHNVAPQLPIHGAGHFIQEEGGEKLDNPDSKVDR